MKKRAIFEASAIVTKLAGNDGIRSVEEDSVSLGRESAEKTTPATAERSRFYMGLLYGKSGRFWAL